MEVRLFMPKYFLDVFENYRYNYQRIFSILYPSKNSTGFTERNLSVNFANAYEQINPSAITWFEFQRQIVKDFFIKFTRNPQKRCHKHRMAPDTSFDRLHFSVQQVFAEIRIVWQLVDIWLPAPLDFG